MKTLQRTLLITSLLSLGFLQAQQNNKKDGNKTVKVSSFSLGYSNSFANSATNDAYIGNSSGIRGDVYISLFRKGWDGTVKGGSFGLNIGGTYDFTGSNNPNTTLPNPYNIVGQTASTVAYSIDKGNKTIFRIGGGPQVNFNLGNNFILSPMILAEYFTMNQKPINIVQTTQINGKYTEYNLLSLPETKTTGLSFTPKLRMQYLFSKNFGVFADAAYIFGPKLNTQVSSLVPLGKPNQMGEYQQDQLQSGTRKKTDFSSTSYNAVVMNVGLSYSFGGNDGSAGTPEPAKVEINKSRSNIKSQISGSVKDSVGTPEPAKASINTSRSNIKQQISGSVKDSVINPQPAKANINKSRSNIKQQISGSVKDPVGTPEPAKASINTSRSNIKQQISGSVKDSLKNPEPVKVEINKSRSNIKSQISGSVKDSAVTPEPAKASINTSRSNIKQ